MRTKRTASRKKKGARDPLDIIDSIAEGQHDKGERHATIFQPNSDGDSDDHDHDANQRRPRRSTRLNRTTGRAVTPFARDNRRRNPSDSPLFVTPDPSDGEGESEAEYVPDNALDEDDDAEEDDGNDARDREEDGESVASKDDDISISDHERQLRQEQEQSIVNSQQEQQLGTKEALATDSVLVVVDSREERVGNDNSRPAKASKSKFQSGAAEQVNFFPEDDDFENGESEEADDNIMEEEAQVEGENAEEPAALDDEFDMDDSRQDVGAALQKMYEDPFDWDGYGSVRPEEPDQPEEPKEPKEPTRRTRVGDRLGTQSLQTGGSSNRKRTRALDDDTRMPDRSRRRIETRDRITTPPRRNASFAIPADIEVANSPGVRDRARGHRQSPNHNIERVPLPRPLNTRGSIEAAEWEATMLEEGSQDDVIVVGETITYDDATKVMDLQGTWKRLIQYCQNLRNAQHERRHRYNGIEAIVERISDLVKDYRRMQRMRFRGRTVDPDTWERTRQEVKYLSKDADKIREVIERRAKEGKDRNDLQNQADAVEYAEVIVQQVMTSLCELALECLRTYYSEEQQWLLNGGFKAVLDIIDVVGRLDLTLTSLHNLSMVVLSPYPGRPIRQELRSIRGSLIRAEANEQRRGP